MDYFKRIKDHVRLVSTVYLRWLTYNILWDYTNIANSEQKDSLQNLVYLFKLRKLCEVEYKFKLIILKFNLIIVKQNLPNKKYKYTDGNWNSSAQVRFNKFNFEIKNQDMCVTTKYLPIKIINNWN